jgi:outer membrane biosynthesis protein TonB
MVGLRRTHELHTSPPSTKPNWPRRPSVFAVGPISLKHTVCAVAGVAVLAVAPATALAVATPSPDPAPGSSTPAKPKPKPVVHVAPKPVVHTTPKPTYTPPVTTTPAPVVHSTPAPIHKVAKKHKARHRKHTVVHHKKKHHVAAAPKVTPAPVQTPAAAQVVSTKPAAVHTAPVALHKSTGSDSNGRLLAFAALALLVLAGASAWMLRYTLRLAQPQRTY